MSNLIPVCYCEHCSNVIEFSPIFDGKEVPCPLCGKWTIAKQSVATERLLKCMRQPVTIKIACPSCAGHIEFPSDMVGQVINCPHCSLSVALQIPGSVAGAPPKKSKNIGCLEIILILGAALVLFFVIPAVMLSDRDNSTQSANDESGHAYFAAVKFCQQFVPSSKNFTTRSGADYLDGRAEWVTNYGNNNIADWYANGWCDSQNKYGALEHQIWGAHVALEGGNWKLNYLSVGNEDIYNKNP